MKNAIILHGFEESPDKYWYSWLKQNLEDRGYNVWLPQIPDFDNPDPDKHSQFVLANWDLNEQTVLIGHSAGVPLSLSVLERLGEKVKQVVLVSGFVLPLENPAPNSILQNKYDWEKIKKSAGEFVFIHSDNDPWGCGEKQGQEMNKHLGGRLIILPGEGHMGSTTYNQPYKEFPLLLELIK